MKISPSLIISASVSINAVSAFVTLPTRNAVVPAETPRFMSDNAMEEFTQGSEEMELLDTFSQFSRSSLSMYLSNELEEIPREATCQKTLQQIRFSKAIPVMRRPAFLDGSLAGDVGFDPLGFVKSNDDLIRFREAEIKHARLAMLAAAGWPVSEFLNKKFASMMNLNPVLDLNGKAPNPITNFDMVDPRFWFAVAAIGAAVEYFGASRSYEKVPGYHPGNLGWDPLNLYPKDTKGRKAMQLAEIKNGRTAMMVLVCYALEEALTKHGVVPSL